MFGVGASVAAVRPCRARQLSRLSDRRHDLVRLQRDKDVFDEPVRQLSRLSDRRHDLVRLQRDKDVFDEPVRSRQGVAHHVGNPKSSFIIVNGPALKLILERLKQQD